MRVVLCEYCKKINRKILGKVVYVPLKNKIDYSAVIRARRSGLTATEVADKFGITPHRVWQILAKQK